MQPQRDQPIDECNDRLKDSLLDPREINQGGGENAQMDQITCGCTASNPRKIHQPPPAHAGPAFNPQLTAANLLPRSKPSGLLTADGDRLMPTAALRRRGRRLFSPTVHSAAINHLCHSSGHSSAHGASLIRPHNGSLSHAVWYLRSLLKSQSQRLTPPPLAPTRVNLHICQFRVWPAHLLQAHI